MWSMRDTWENLVNPQRFDLSFQNIGQNITGVQFKLVKDFDVQVKKKNTAKPQY